MKCCEYLQIMCLKYFVYGFRCCLIFWTGQQMYAAVDPDKNGARIFEDKTIEDAAARAIEGSFLHVKST